MTNCNCGAESIVLYGAGECPSALGDMSIAFEVECECSQLRRRVAAAQRASAAADMRLLEEIERRKALEEFNDYW